MLAVLLAVAAPHGNIRRQDRFEIKPGQGLFGMLFSYFGKLLDLLKGPIPDLPTVGNPFTSLPTGFPSENAVRCAIGGSLSNAVRGPVGNAFGGPIGGTFCVLPTFVET